MAKLVNIVFKNSIGLILLRFVFGCYLFVTIIVTATQLYFEYSNVEKGVITELHNIGRSFEDSLSSALWTLDKEVIPSILLGVQKIESIAGARIVSQDHRMEGGTGIAKEDIASELIFIRNISASGIDAREVALWIDGEENRFYEYELEIFYQESKHRPRLPVGFVYLYVPRDTVISRFKDSLFLILINAAIKTFALWVFFLYFSRRFLSQPLSDLTQATSTVADDIPHSDDISYRLGEMAKASKKNELQQLAASFLAMENSIQEKIDNLNTLNNFAVSLTQTKSQPKIYERLFLLLSQTFGIESGSVFDKNDALIWATEDFDQKSKEGKMCLADVSLNMIRGHNEIMYQPNKPNRSLTDSAEYVPIFYLPLQFGLDEKSEVWLLGEVQPSRLNVDSQLSEESHSFLRVMANLVSATLTKILQREIIEEQTRYLESCVLERTQELTKANSELHHMTVHDPLTHLSNRILFNDRLTQMINIAARDNIHFAVASIDLVEFKQINDSYGHDVGDKVLIEVGRRFSKALRKSDTLSRMGGDEFAAILQSDNTEDSIEIVLTRLLASLQDAILTHDGESVLANANIGVAFFPDHATDPKRLFKYADIAMYQAKRSSQGYAIFDKEKNSREKNHQEFMFELEHAITKDQLRLHYQPIVDIKSNQPIAFEALLRWEHPDRGIVLPEMFIPHAERTALIRPITFWLIRHATQQCAQWHADGIIVPISINLSARIFTTPELPEQLLDILRDVDLEPKWLKLEITENAAMINPKKTLPIITQLTSLGFMISIDNFGTGHSSLSHLSHLPINELKIDPSFILNNDKNSQIVIQTIIELSHSLDFYVVAEGIADEKTLGRLAEQGCAAVQGDYICRPNESTLIKKWYRDCVAKGDGFLPKPNN